MTLIGFPRTAGTWLSLIKGNIVSREGREIVFSGAIDAGNSGGPMIKEGEVVMRSECRDQTRCLHLVATGGHPSKGTAEDWKHLSRAYPRVPLGVANSGVVAASGKAMLINDAERVCQWVPASVADWARRVGFQSFAGFPLIFRGEMLGVFTICCCVPISETEYP